MNCSIWLSKQPLPFWIVGGVSEIFGSSLFIMRLPGLIAAVFSVFLTYLITKKLFSVKIGLLAMFFHAIHGLNIQVTSGAMSGDHVDSFFLLFLEIAIYSLIRYTKKPRKLIIPGVFTGCSFLCKWIQPFSIVVVFPLMMWLISGRQFSTMLKGMLYFVAGFLLITMPYQLYALVNYPEVYLIMWNEILEPVHASVHNRGFPWYHYIDDIRIQYGELIYLPLIWILFNSRKGNNSILALWIYIPLILLSIAVTKRMTHFLPIAPAIFILSAVFFYQIYDQIRLEGRKSTRVIKVLLCALIVLLPIRYTLERFSYGAHEQLEHSGLGRMETFNDSFEHVNSFNTVIFGEPHYLESMFFTGATVYPFVPDNDVMDSLRNVGYRVVKLDSDRYVQLK